MSKDLYDVHRIGDAIHTHGATFHSGLYIPSNGIIEIDGKMAAMLPMGQPRRLTPSADEWLDALNTLKRTAPFDQVRSEPHFQILSLGSTFSDRAFSLDEATVISPLTRKVRKPLNMVRDMNGKKNITENNAHRFSKLPLSFDVFNLLASGFRPVTLK